MAFNDIYRLRLYGRLHGSQIVNVMHFVQDDPLPTVGGQELANDFVTKMATTLRARCTSQMLYEFVEVQSIVPFSGGPVTANFPANSTGTSSGGCVSATLAEVITIYSSRAGKRGRGRIYLTGSDQSFGTAVSAGTWLTGQTAKTQAFATQLANQYMNALGGIQWKLGVWSKVIAGPTPPWPSSAFVRATGLTVRTIVRTQRRRQVGVGR